MLGFNKLKKVGVQARNVRHKMIGSVVVTHKLVHRKYGHLGYYFLDNGVEKFTLFSDRLLSEYKKSKGKIVLL